MEPAETTVDTTREAGAGSMSPASSGCACRITDDDILSLWRTVRPSAKQDAAMTYESGPYDVTCPTWELRRLVELAIEYGHNPMGLRSPRLGGDKQDPVVGHFNNKEKI